MRSTLVSKVAIFSACSPDGSAAIHSRSPDSRSPSRAPLLIASARLLDRLMEKACVGPPATTSATSRSGSAGCVRDLGHLHINRFSKSLGDGAGDLFGVAEHRLVDNKRLHLWTSSSLAGSTALKRLNGGRGSPFLGSSWHGQLVRVK